jgi:hypothetical protein
MQAMQTQQMFQLCSVDKYSWAIVFGCSYILILPATPLFKLA